MEIKKFPKDMSVLEVDKIQPRRCLVSGLFEESVEVNGQNRVFYTYIKEGLLYNSPCVAVAIPDDVELQSYLESSPWIDFAEKHDTFLHFLIPGEGGWDVSGADAEYMNKAYVQINGRKAYIAMQDNIYAIGVGKGAVVAQQAVMKMSSEWSGLATFGDMVPETLAGAAVAAKSEDTGKVELVVAAAKVQVPVWMAWSQNTGANAEVCAYWKKANDSEDEAFSSQFADEIYFPSTICHKSQINEEKISQVRVTNGFAGTVETAFLDAIWAYLSKACRHRGFGVKMLRNRIDPEAYGFTYHTMEMDGFTRSWYEYVPQQVVTSGQKVPLLFCMHGRGGTAETFISLSGMSRVAEERNFIAVFPEAGVYQQKPGTLRNLLLWNGEYQGKKIDDVAFVLAIVEDIKKRCQIDTTRIYASGQSSGGMMTTTLALQAQKVFAAVAPWSALVNPDEELVLPEKIEPAVPFFFLFGDKDWVCADPKNDEFEYHVGKDIAAFLKNLIRVYKLDEKPLHYVCGEISYYVYLNEKKVPMLTVGRVDNMPHANYPGESWASYDLFLSRFSKQEDGTLLYMGSPAL